MCFYLKRMPINYNTDYNDPMITILTDNGYEVKGNYVHGHKNASNVYLLSDGSYAKFYGKDVIPLYDWTYNWTKMKLTSRILSELNLTPNIIGIIDVDESSGFIISESFGVPLSSFKWNNKIRSIVIQSLNKLHDCGYIHCDLHMDNILFDEDSCEVRFIDLDNCYHIDDDRLLPFIMEFFDVDSIDKAKEMELSNVYLEV